MFGRVRMLERQENLAFLLAHKQTHKLFHSPAHQPHHHTTPCRNSHRPPQSARRRPSPGSPTSRCRPRRLPPLRIPSLYTAPPPSVRPRFLCPLVGVHASNSFLDPARLILHLSPFFPLLFLLSLNIRNNPSPFSPFCPSSLNSQLSYLTNSRPHFPTHAQTPAPS